MTAVLRDGEAPLAILSVIRHRGPTLLVAALIAIAALVLHELRYLIGYGDHSAEALAAQGHAYLSWASGAAMLLLALGVGQLLLVLRGALRSATAAPRAPFGVLWLASACALLAVYSGQELLEGALSAGHLDGLAALAADGGWSALPLAFALGAAVALLLRGAAAAEALAARLGRRSARIPGRALAARPLALPAFRPAVCVLARKLASRAPPVPAHAA